MRIQELERKTGLERPSIRFYEKEGLLNPARSENGYREYSDEDVELLKKIKLLRRLGMSIEKIKALQQGSADLSSAIAQQTSYLTSQIDEHRRCRAVCEIMQRDGAVFESLDADHYLRLLREIRIDDKVLSNSNFQENVPKEIHPWLRYFARILDYGLWNAFIQFILIVIVRMRPIPGNFLSSLITIVSTALFVPVEAWMLHKFGTTPGKWAMGIRLEYYQGGNLPYSEALNRSLNVYVCGAGLSIPVVQMVLYILRYCQLTGRSWRIFARYNEVEGPQDMSWDASTEIIYEKRDWKRGVALSLILAMTVLLTVGGVIDGFKPRYRGNELTVAQVAQNYNATLDVILEDAAYYDKLQEDGTKKPVASNTVIFDMNSSVSGQPMQFEYEVQDGIVRSVSVHHEWDEVFYLRPLSDETLLMASSLLLAQEDCGIRELGEFARLYESYLDQKEVSFTYKNLLIEWTITTDQDFLQGTVYGGDEEDVYASLDFRVTIQK